MIESGETSVIPTIRVELARTGVANKLVTSHSPSGAFEVGVVTEGLEPSWNHGRWP